MAFVPTLDLHEHTLPGLLRRNAERLPDNDCIVAPEFGVCWSWKEFDRRTSEVARGMYAMGIRKGDHVAIWSTNTPEWMLTMFASAKLGAILVTVNTNYKQFELNYLLNQSDTKMLVMTAGVKNNDYISHITGLVPRPHHRAAGQYLLQAAALSQTRAAHRRQRTQAHGYEPL